MAIDKWTETARLVRDVYGSYVDWDEEFFICPECDEPIYKCDWNEFSICPVCEFDFAENAAD